MADGVIKAPFLLAAETSVLGAKNVTDWLAVSDNSTSHWAVTLYVWSD